MRHIWQLVILKIFVKWNDTIDEEVLESVEYPTKDSEKKEIALEICYEKKKCETELKTEIETLWNDVKDNFES